MTIARTNAQTHEVLNCLLYDSGCPDRQGKSEGFCKKCGWDTTEARRRKQMIRYGHLTTDRYGCRKLIVKHEDEP